MEFYDISDEEPANPGEMLLYSPRHTIVVCAGIVDDKMRAFDRGSFLEDDIENFKKIKITNKEFRKRTRSKCKGCGGGSADSSAQSIPTATPKTATGCKGCGSKK
tara:strand:- start:691 stop:1005 length:315 start_codon:yes stop_codon:yes gene_type:complete